MIRTRALTGARAYPRGRGRRGTKEESPRRGPGAPVEGGRLDHSGSRQMPRYSSPGISSPGLKKATHSVPGIEQVGSSWSQ